MASAELSTPSLSRADRGSGMPEPWHVRYRMPLLITAGVLPLYLLWWTVFATGGGDLAAQEAWAGFARRYPGSAYSLFWYGGLHTANYSVISPYLMAAFGVRTVAAASGIAATWMGVAIIMRSGIRKPLWPSVIVGFSMWCQVVCGRATFMLGVAFGVGAVLAVTGTATRRRVAGATLCAALATMGSPVAGLFLVVVGGAYLLLREWGKGLALILPPFVVVGLTTWLFPFEGEQPMAFIRIFPPVLLCGVVILAAPRSWKLLKVGAAVYAVGVVLTWLIPTPIGTNVERFAEIAAPPILLAAVLNRKFSTLRLLRPSGTPRHFWHRTVLICAVVLSLIWVSVKTTSDIVAYTKVPTWAVETDGVVKELNRLGAERTRVEVVPARDHREAAVLSPYINMARGWNRQADVERGRLFYEGRPVSEVKEGAFTSSSYRAWLNHWAVGFVVLYKGDGKPDGAAEREHDLVTSEPSYLDQVWHDDNWRIYRVKDAVPLVDKPGSVVTADGAHLTVRMSEPGSVTVRVAYSPWLWAEGGCLYKEGDFTRLTVKKPGDVRIASNYGGPSGPQPKCEPDPDKD
ncbi:membrane protein [Streptomyces alboflavus]|uniref:Membrane protein n=2 Tax=Streptomyces TaxID=1883 RepID=A0A1Z1WCK1_9ACTN|nr:membrane protein [Streptomyces alboflavus]